MIASYLSSTGLSFDNRINSWMENNFLGQIDKFMSLEIFVALVPNTIKTPRVISCQHHSKTNNRDGFSFTSGTIIPILQLLYNNHIRFSIFCVNYLLKKSLYFSILYHFYNTPYIYTISIAQWPTTTTLNDPQWPLWATH